MLHDSVPYKSVIDVDSESLLLVQVLTYVCFITWAGVCVSAL